MSVKLQAFSKFTSDDVIILFDFKEFSNEYLAAKYAYVHEVMSILLNKDSKQLLEKYKNYGALKLDTPEKEKLFFEFEKQRLDLCKNFNQIIIKEKNVQKTYQKNSPQYRESNRKITQYASEIYALNFAMKSACYNNTRYNKRFKNSPNTPQRPTQKIQSSHNR